ncbi:hypothetical protein AVEN_45721-1 [Araneus ventricosus]|uniref:Uncharacterized protein n=1 Tax=Araneus ventricosus TaxID=182803 RepID=A0A4Y2KDK1_ARAVE|nr:hypothetical protein AVEN_45721-1 [Araneus ventricosus]
MTVINHGYSVPPKSGRCMLFLSTPSPICLVNNTPKAVPTSSPFPHLLPCNPNGVREILTGFKSKLPFLPTCLTNDDCFRCALIRFPFRGVNYQLNKESKKSYEVMINTEIGSLSIVLFTSFTRIPKNASRNSEV